MEDCKIPTEYTLTKNSDWISRKLSSSSLANSIPLSVNISTANSKFSSDIDESKLTEKVRRSFKLCRGPNRNSKFQNHQISPRKVQAQEEEKIEASSVSSNGFDNTIKNKFFTARDSFSTKVSDPSDL